MTDGHVSNSVLQKAKLGKLLPSPVSQVQLTLRNTRYKNPQLVAQHSVFCCKTWINVSRSSACVITLPRNKNICCGLKKVGSTSSNKSWLWCSFSQIRNLYWIHSKQINQSARYISSTRNKCFFVFRQIDHAMWKKRRPKTCNHKMLRDKLRAFVSRISQPKWLIFMYFGEREPQWLIFGIFFWNW